MSVFVCTREGLVRLLRAGRSWTAEPALEGAGVELVIVQLRGCDLQLSSIAGTASLA